MREITALTAVTLADADPDPHLLRISRRRPPISTAWALQTRKVGAGKCWRMVSVDRPDKRNRIAISKVHLRKQFWRPTSTRRHAVPSNIGINVKFSSTGTKPFDWMRRTKLGIAWQT